MCAHKLHRKSVHSPKRVAHQSIGVPQKIGTTRNGGRINRVLTVAKKDTHHATVQRSGRNANPRKRKKTEMMPENPALLASLASDNYTTGENKYPATHQKTFH